MARAHSTGVLNRLRRDNRGNVMMLTAAAVIPLLGMVGAAFDVSRVYLVKTRLQHACDASVLAYRRSMIGSNSGPANVTFADTYFRANFTPGRYGSNSATMTYTPDSRNVIHGDAKVIVPMSVMKVFSMRQVALEATCNAQLQLPNTDVMFVLDTTGSMTDTNPGDSSNKITALQNAVMNFYNTLEGAKIPGTQVRYGFVPYSNTVNVGMLLNRDWMVNSANYQTRDWSGPVQTGTTGSIDHYYFGWTPNSPTVTSYSGDPENCVAPASTITTSNASSSAWNPSATAVPRSRTNYRTVDGSSYSAAAQKNGTCKITKSTYTNYQQQQTEGYENNPSGGTPVYSYYWNYRQRQVDVSALKGSASSGLMTGGSFPQSIGSPTTSTGANAQPTSVPITWNASSACIEERKTLRPGDSGTAEEPFDENVDKVPDANNSDTQWRPLLPQLVYARNVSSNYTGASASGWSWSYLASLSATNFVNMNSYPYDRAACPSPARKLMSKEQGLTQTVLQSYVNGLKTGGDTYHDIGFLWGLRLASAQGLFKSENVSAPNGYDISRNIIFMTDGDTESHIQDYEAYGLSALDRRRTANPSGHLPTDNEQNTIVEDRLSKYCTVAKAKGMTVWVIAFGTSLTSLLSDCASSGRAYQANNAAALDAAFADIASKIAQLRLTQ